MGSDIVLALDNSLDFLNLALGEGNRLIEERRSRADRLSSEVLPIRVSQLLADHGISPARISLLVVTLGPGSFTGVRVGLAFCKGLSSGLAIPLVGVATPYVLAMPFDFMEGSYLCPLIDAKKGEVFFALYLVVDKKIVPIDATAAVRPEELREKIQTPCVCFGSGIELCEPVLAGLEGVRAISAGFQSVSGEALLRSGLAKYEVAGGEGEKLDPIYGRRSGSRTEVQHNYFMTAERALVVALLYDSKLYYRTD